MVAFSEDFVLVWEITSDLWVILHLYLGLNCSCYESLLVGIVKATYSSTSLLRFLDRVIYFVYDYYKCYYEELHIYCVIYKGMYKGVHTCGIKGFVMIINFL